MQPVSNQQDYAEDLDALAAAPRHHVLLFENDRVRVLDTCVAPGETVPLHTHRWPATLYILSWSDFLRRDGEGEVVVDSRAAGFAPDVGSAVWTGPLAPHTLENVGKADLRAISVEIKAVS
jgi:quercetin dioxygenase-like cupin family protein